MQILSSKNLSIGEKLAMTEEFQKEVALENEKKKSEAQKTFQGNQHVDFTPIGVNSKIDGRKDSWTDSQTAKKAGVSTDTYSKGKKILDSDNEELKKEVLSGEKTINAGYKELQNENKMQINVSSMNP